MSKTSGKRKFRKFNRFADSFPFFILSKKDHFQYQQLYQENCIAIYCKQLALHSKHLFVYFYTKVLHNTNTQGNTNRKQVD